MGQPRFLLLAVLKPENFLRLLFVGGLFLLDFRPREFVGLFGIRY